jgi:hypothetical protein
MPNRPPTTARAYFLAVAGILALTDALFGPRIQAWYRTMPANEAKGIGGGILLGLLVVVCLGFLFVISRSSDA